LKAADCLTADVIHLNHTAADWEAALRAGGGLLVRAGKCTPAYVDAMVAAVRHMGPYVVLAPGIALGHARPQDGALGTGISLVTLAKSVDFGSPENDPVWLVISFCAGDGEGHIDLLSDLARFLGSEVNIQRLKTAKTAPEVLKLFESSQQGGEQQV